MLVPAVVVHGNGCGADVHVTADLGIADVGQVRHLRALPHPRSLDLDERPRLGVLLQHRPRAEARVRPDVHMRADPRAPDHRVLHGGGVPDRGIDDARGRAEHAVPADPRIPLQEGLRVDGGVAADPDADVDERLLRREECDAVVHVRRVDPPPHHRSRLRELGAGVHTHGAAVVDELHRDPLALLVQDPQDVGEVVLALAVVSSHERQRLVQGLAPEQVHACGHLVDGELLGRGVRPLSELHEIAAGVPDHPGERARIVGDRRLHDCRRVAPADLANQVPKLPGRGERLVAVADEHGVGPAHRALGRLDGVPGAERFPLVDEHRLRRDPPLTDGRLHLLGMFVDDDDQAVGLHARDRAEHVPQHRPTAHGVQHLGKLRLQSLPLSRGEHDRGEGGT